MNDLRRPQENAGLGGLAQIAGMCALAFAYGEARPTSVGLNRGEIRAMARVVLYRGSAKDVNDPSGQGRVVVEVPALGVNVRLGWAKVYTVPIGLSWAVLPEVGDEVLVTFELGNLTLPVIFPPAAGQLIPGLMLLRGVVVDASDPLGQKRVRVMVPALSEELMPWGPVCTPLTPATARTLALDMKVAVAFQGGDKNYPVVLGRLP